MEEIIRFGDYSAPYLTGNPRLLERSDDLDRLTLPYAAPTKDAFRRGAAAPSPWEHFVIADIDKEDTGTEWLHNLTCEGIEGGADRIIGDMTPEENLEGWDTLSFVELTRNPRKYRAGQYLTGGSWQHMVCTSARPQKARGPWYKLQVQGQGLIGPKDRLRVITCNGQTISADSITWNLPDGWNTPRRGVVDLPQIQVVDTYYGTTPPPSQDVPGSKAPPNAPPLRQLGNVVINNAVWYWPAGWKFTTGGTQLGNSSLWATQYIYAVQWRTLPG